jgi:histidyl-tRNA synthetase
VEPVSLRISHVGVIKAFLAALGLDESERAEVFDGLLDGEPQALDRIRGKSPNLEQALQLLFDIKGETAALLDNIKAVLPDGSGEVASELDNLAEVARILSATGVSFMIDLPSARGFEYYTGTVFQVFVGDKKVGGGGRYDELLPVLGGPALPACGFALYSDELMSLLPDELIASNGREHVAVVPGSGNLQEMAACLEAARLIRRAGFVASIAFDGQELTKARWRLSISPDGAKNRYVLVDQTTSVEVVLTSASEVVDRLGGGW